MYALFSLLCLQKNRKSTGDIFCLNQSVKRKKKKWKNERKSVQKRERNC